MWSLSGLSVVSRCASRELPSSSYLGNAELGNRVLLLSSRFALTVGKLRASAKSPLESAEDSTAWLWHANLILTPPPCNSLPILILSSTFSSTWVDQTIHLSCSLAENFSEWGHKIHREQKNDKRENDEIKRELERERGRERGEERNTWREGGEEGGKVVVHISVSVQQVWRGSALSKAPWTSILTFFKFFWRKLRIVLLLLLLNSPYGEEIARRTPFTIRDFVIPSCLP